LRINQTREFLARRCIKPDIASIAAANVKSTSLCSENHNNYGMADSNDDNAAPAPNATNIAGSAHSFLILALISCALRFLEHILAA